MKQVYPGRRRLAATVFFVQLSSLAIAQSPLPADTPPSTVPPVPPRQPAPTLPPSHPFAQDMQTIMALLRNHDKVSYVVRDIPNGVCTITSSKDPEIAKEIQTHSADMKLRMENGDNIRPADPLFVELFRHHRDIKIVMKNVPGGTEVDETSTDPQAVLLIRAHTKTVSEFVRDGLPRAKKPSPLPDGYHPDPPTTNSN